MSSAAGATENPFPTEKWKKVLLENNTDTFCFQLLNCKFPGIFEWYQVVNQIFCRGDPFLVVTCVSTTPTQRNHIQVTCT